VTDPLRQFLQDRDVLFAYVLALVRDRDAAEEIFQELGVSILSEAGRGVRPGDFGAWARAMARHRIADHFRRTGRRAECNLEDFGQVVEQAFVENADALERHKARLAYLRECIERLGRKARWLIDGRYGQRLSISQLASKLGWQPGSVKVALSRARRALGQCVEQRMRAAGYDERPATG